jgi:LuxR family maltose regulon positive regulatory protein
LTAAELKVVHYLPSNLNLGDIATRLFVSRNTVKSHVSSIYRKLGTTSRSRAVELAREAGFLNDQARDLS